MQPMLAIPAYCFKVPTEFFSSASAGSAQSVLPSNVKGVEIGLYVQLHPVQRRGVLEYGYKARMHMYDDD